MLCTSIHHRWQSLCLAVRSDFPTTRVLVCRISSVLTQSIRVLWLIMTARSGGVMCAYMRVVFLPFVSNLFSSRPWATRSRWTATNADSREVSPSSSQTSEITRMWWFILCPPSPCTSFPNHNLINAFDRSFAKLFISQPFISRQLNGTLSQTSSRTQVSTSSSAVARVDPCNPQIHRSAPRYPPSQPHPG